MRHFQRFFFALFGVALVSSSCAHSQQLWSGILSPSRATDWSHAGLPSTFPDGETTPNPWTPPTRPACTSAQAGITVPVSASVTASQLATALHNCSVANPKGSYLQLGNGTFNLGGGHFYFVNYGNNITLRGNGPQNTTITNGAITFGISAGTGIGTVTTSPAQGATSVTVNNLNPIPAVGDIAWFTQCDSGYSGTGNCTGSYSNASALANSTTGGVYVCWHSSTCTGSGIYTSVDPTGSDMHHQEQRVKVTSVTNNGGGNYTIGFTPGLYMPNWSTGNTMTIQWTEGNLGIGDGLENLTIDSVNAVIDMSYAYASWVKGVSFIGFNSGGLNFSLHQSKNFLVANNYFFNATPSAPNEYNMAMHMGVYEDSDTLIINNIFDQGQNQWNKGNGGDVFAYNYTRDVHSGYYQSGEFQHGSAGFSSFFLDEGNFGGSMLYDDTHVTHAFSTTFRNWYACGDQPYIINGYGSTAIQIGDYARFMNLVGNVLGGQSNACSTYSSEIELRPGNDALAHSSAMLWGQYDAANAAQRFESSEVPTSLSGNATPFVNSVPASHTLPASFFMNSMTAHPSGGTGLEWWKVCTNYPTCSTSQTPPMPPVHPESTGGVYMSGRVDAIPALIAYNTLPIISSLQNHYTITGSSYSGGIETLTLSATPASGTIPATNSVQFFGGFQLSGANAACSTGATLPNGEILMTGSSVSPTYTVKYALAADPGVSCTGQVLWPDVRAFDERVYQTDSLITSTGTTVDPPVGLGASAR